MIGSSFPLCYPQIGALNLLYHRALCFMDPLTKHIRLLGVAAFSPVPAAHRPAFGAGRCRQAVCLSQSWFRQSGVVSSHPPALTQTVGRHKSNTSARRRPRWMSMYGES
jgi:hypothetical protein